MEQLKIDIPVLNSMDHRLFNSNIWYLAGVVPPISAEIFRHICVDTSLCYVPKNTGMGINVLCLT